MSGALIFLKHPELKGLKLTQKMADNLYALSKAEDGEMKFGGHTKVQGRALINRGLAYWGNRIEGIAVIDDKGLKLIKILLKIGVLERGEK